jgi:methylenetetrahydrofolate dehydrogenase (NADP+)/methenyltetrahydrofolate cyclohydrolase
MNILNGKTISEEILLKLKNKITTFTRPPRLDIILVGNDYASEKYVALKENKAKEIGMDVKVHKFEENIKEEEVNNLILQLNEKKEVDGIMVQLPLPQTFNEDRVVSKISVDKDVDGLTAESLGRLFRKEECFTSATPKGIGILLERYGIDVSGKNVVVIGRSKIVGLPASALMLSKDATVTVCHPLTSNIQEISKTADILIVAVGQPNFVTKEFVKEGAVVIDVGFNKDLENGKTVGDVSFEDVQPLVSYITPVPGGVGPMTIASLLENVVESYEKRNA